MTNIENITHFIGIDISKKTLDIAVLNQNEFLSHHSIDNTKKALRCFFNTLKKAGVCFDKSIVCAEFTGIYAKHLLDFSSDLSLNLWMENAFHIKKTQGLKRGKNDKVDAVRIAGYAFRHRYDYKGFKRPRPIIKQLKTLVGQRKRLVAVRKQLSSAMAENQFRTQQENNLINSTAKNTMDGLEKDIKLVEAKIRQLIREDQQLERQYKIVTSVDGVGPITAINMILITNEFKDISQPKKFACYSGVVPFQYTSGTSVTSKAKVSKMANHQMKTLLHMAALSSIQIQGDLQDFYLRKVQEGKNKMSIINAVRNKIVLRVFACVKNNRMYQKNYNNALV